MAIPISINKLLEDNIVEWARIEFKEGWNPDTTLKTISAFANDIDNWGGGYIVIGVKDVNGKPIELSGIEPTKVDIYLKDMLNKCKLIQPEYMPITEVTEYQGKKFIVIWAPGGSQRPYSSPKNMAKDNKERIYYIRKMASTISPTESEKRDLYSLANNIPFDDRINHESDITDLNITLIQSYLKEVGSSLYDESYSMNFIDLCKNMNIVNSLPEYIKPKNVGLMFFSLNPQKFFPYAQIDVVQFPDGLGGDRIIEKTFRGPLHQQLREALQYIQNMVIQERVYKIDNRAEADRIFNYPYAAIEEVLSNAVYHKGYDVREPIEVRVLPDRIEVVSHPGPDRSITEEGLKTYRVFNRRYRNRRIGEFLKEMHLTEGRNTGFRKILNALEKNGSPKPLFEMDPERLSFYATIFIHKAFLDNEPINEPINEKSNFKRNEMVSKLASSEISVLKCFHKMPNTSVANVAVCLGVSRATVVRIVKVLREKGLLHHEGPKKNGTWILNEVIVKSLK